MIGTSVRIRAMAALAVACGAGLASTASADTFTLFGPRNEVVSPDWEGGSWSGIGYYIDGGGSQGPIGQPNLKLGNWDGRNTAILFRFGDLPALPAGHVIASASLRTFFVYKHGDTAANYNGDLALMRKTSTDVFNADFQLPGTAVQDDFLSFASTGTTNTFVSSSTAGAATLARELNAGYAAGAGVVLRLKQDAVGAPYDAYILRNDDAVQPTLTLVTGRPGDANLDASVNFDDLLLLAANYNGSAGVAWGQGDFTLDGNVNFDDLLQLAANYNTVGGSFAGDWALAQASVPEPTTALSLASLMGLSLTRRRAIARDRARRTGE